MMIKFSSSLDVLAAISVCLTYICGFGMLWGFYSTETYPFYIWFILLASFGFVILTGLLLIQTLSSNSNAQKIFSYIFSLFFIFMIFIPMKLKPDLHANPLVTPNIYHYMELSYFGLLLSLSASMHALRLKTDVIIDTAKIPWSVNLAGFMLLIAAFAFTSRSFILYYLGIPMFNLSGYTLIFLSIGLLFFTIQFFGKHGPFYRSANGQQYFTSFSFMLLFISILHSIGPFLRQIANFYHYTDQQYLMAITLNRVTAGIEIIACGTIFYCMRQLKTTQYYYDLSY